MTGQWPTPQAQAAQSGQAAYPYYGRIGAYPPPFAPAGVGMGFPPGTKPGMAPDVPKEQELEWLKKQTQMLVQQLEHINNRIKQLEEASSE